MTTRRDQGRKAAEASAAARHPDGAAAVDMTVAALRALAHPVRLGIMRRLAERPETCACDFTDLFEVSQPTISAHLKVLREAGLVRTRRRGNQICYSVNDEGIAVTVAVIAELRPAPLAGAS